MKTISALFSLCALAGAPLANAANLSRSTITDVVKDVNVIAAGTRAQKSARVKDTFAVPDVMRTGADSRAEMIAEDQTVTRVGASTLFSFEPEKREVNLERGSVLFHSPTGKGGGTIKTAAATASVLGTTLIVAATKGGGFKVLLLEGKGRVTTPRGESRTLVGGQMTWMLAGQKLGPVMTFQLRDQVAASKLVSGFDKPLPSLAKIIATIAAQETALGKGRLIQTGLLAGDSPDVGYQVDPNAREAILEKRQERRRQRAEKPAPSRFGIALNTDAVIDSLTLDGRRIFTFGGKDDAPDFKDAPDQPAGTTGGAGNATLFIARNTTFATSAVDLSDFGGRDLFQFLSVKDLHFARSVRFVGLGRTPLSLVAGGTITAPIGTVVSASTSLVELAAFGSVFEIGNAPEPARTSDPKPLSLTRFTLQNAAGALLVTAPAIGLRDSDFLGATGVTLAAPGAIAIDGSRNGSVLSSGPAGGSTGGGATPPATSLFRGKQVTIAAGGPVGAKGVDFTSQATRVNSGRAIVMRSVAFSDGTTPSDGVSSVNSGASLRAVSLVDLNGANFNVQNVAMQARTINLTNVNFRDGSVVVLDSANGKLAPNPNQSRPSMPNFVNFIKNVNYGGQPAQGVVNESIFIK